MAHKYPEFYFANEFQEFKELFSKHHFTHRLLKKGTTLTDQAIINNTAYFIIKGTMRFSLFHANGKEQTISLFGPGEIFPIGVKEHHHRLDYEMVLSAFNDMEVYQFTYPQLRQLALSHPVFAVRLLEVDCDFINYLFYMSSNLAFNPCITRVCDILYLLIPEEKRHLEASATVQIDQSLLTTFVGASRPEVERALRSLREEKIIQTGRKKIFIPNIGNLLKKCSVSII